MVVGFGETGNINVTIFGIMVVQPTTSSIGEVREFDAVSGADAY